jgi:hypothetical protein
MWRLLSKWFRCQHTDAYHERRDHKDHGPGTLHLVCRTCDHATAIVMGDKAKIKKLQKQWDKSRVQPSVKTKADVYVLPLRDRRDA